MLSVSALSGSYTDLIDTPQNVSEFTNDSDFHVHGCLGNWYSPTKEIVAHMGLS